jgi:STAS domain
MTANEFCDSTALAALVQANRHAESAGVEIRLVMDGGAVRRIFKLTSVDRVFRMFDDIPAAVSAPGGPAHPCDVSSSEHPVAAGPVRDLGRGISANYRPSLSPRPEPGSAGWFGQGPGAEVVASGLRNPSG